MLKVIKRSGVSMPFDRERIVQALRKAFIQVDGKIYEDDTINEIADEVIYKVSTSGRVVSVEEIQDMVEELLMDSNRKDVAREYIRYRYKRQVARNSENDFIKALSEKINANGIENSNANMDESSFSGRIGAASDLQMKKFALDYCLSSMARRNYENNEIYTHDLNHYGIGDHNCLTCDVDELLANGFTTRQVDIRPPQSVSTAFQLLAVVFQLQSLGQFGGISASHVDTSMVPYVRKSFFKHFKDGLKYVDKGHYNTSIGKKDIYWTDLTNKERYVDNTFPIDHRSYKAMPLAYEYAMDMTLRETYQAVEGLYHNLNSLQSRSGGQLPFSSINYGVDTSTEGRMVTKAILDVSIKGLGPLYKTSIFPCGIFTMKQGINRQSGDPNYDLYRLALKSTALRLYPNYANGDCQNQKDWLAYDRKIKREVINALSEDDYCKLRINLKHHPDIAKKLLLRVNDNNIIEVIDEEQPYEVFSTMGCRTQTSSDINFKPCYKANIRKFIDEEKLDNDVWSAAQKDKRGNCCPVTIILPTLAMEAREINEKKPGLDFYYGDDAITEFMELLDQKIHEAKDMLIERYEYICSQSIASAKFSYDNKLLIGFDGKTIESSMRHFSLAIGQLGLAECLQILIGEDQTSPRGFELACRIEQLFKDRCAQFKEEYSLNFGVYYSPAESLCHTALKKFRDKYGVIPNVSDKEFFSNSVHTPVWKQISPFDKIDIEAPLDAYSSAGCILYVELDTGMENNLDALETLVNYAMDKGVPYLAVNVPADMCLDCGYQKGEFNDKCPECGSSHIQQLRRVTGYLTGSYTTAFNAGKIDEVHHRVKHVGYME